MHQDSVNIIACGPAEECFPIYRSFLEKNEKLKSFPAIPSETKRDLYPAVFNRIRDKATSPELLRLSLNFLRVLSRERSTLEMSLDPSMIDTLLKFASLKSHKEFINCGYPEILESLKVIFNMVFQSSHVQEMFIENELIESLISTVKGYSTPSSTEPLDVKYFTLRILFIITALCQSVVPKIRRELNGLAYLNQYLEQLASQEGPYDDQTVVIICEAQKALYNLIHDIVPHKSSKGFVVEEQDSIQLTKTTQLVRLFLLHECNCPMKTEELKSHSIDLLAGVTNDCFSELIVKSNDQTVYEFENYDLGAIEVIANFLRERLEGGQRDRSMSEALAPVLSVLIRMTSSVRLIRKYLKKRILPPLTKADVMERPEVGNTLRNRLCVLLTSPGYISELVSSFLFILCKENVQRLVKYTGFGNAAGLLANRGLLSGGKTNNTGEYSDDSMNSDTEEYKEISSRINDVEGRVQVEHPDPFEGMSEEQKEYEAMELVKALDHLHKKDVFQPCKIGPDGRPVAVDHICELLENASNDTLIRSNRSESSDSE